MKQTKTSKVRTQKSTTTVHAPAAQPIKVTVTPSKPIQTIIGRRSASKVPVKFYRQPSRITDIIVAPTSAEFQAKVKEATGTANRYEFKDMKGYAFYPEGAREGAPSKPRIITWVKPGPITAAITATN